MTVNAPIYLLDFPELIEADMRVQLGRMLPDTHVTAYTQAGEIEQWKPECDAIILIWDGLTVLSLVRKLFEKQPQANVVVLAAQGDANRAEDLMGLGVMDYRMLPCPDEAMEIYVRKAGHQAELSRQAETQRQGSDVFITQDIDTRRLLDQVALIAPSQASVLVVGESG
ncbi:MAG: sigma-54-dependent Fis family transcriptional regulator, partial [Mariprofundaceae bacterium]|nr:sigma-54-dependent Fis family transcriptional regulator [Mariprofundaceae bacterium]